jgi:hypothetical protein
LWWCQSVEVTLPYRPLADPCLLVTVGGRRLPGTALGWRGQRVYLSWIAGSGLQHLGWKDAGLVSRRDSRTLPLRDSPDASAR